MYIVFTMCECVIKDIPQYLIGSAGTTFIKYKQTDTDKLLIIYRKVKGILLYQGFPRPILSTNDQKGMFCRQLVEGTRG